jgi:hypothetical protein
VARRTPIAVLPIIALLAFPTLRKVTPKLKRR